MEMLIFQQLSAQVLVQMEPNLPILLDQIIFIIQTIFMVKEQP